MLLVAVQSEVLSYGLRSGREEVLLATDKDRVVFSLDYDLVERKVFWMAWPQRASAGRTSTRARKAHW